MTVQSYSAICGVTPCRTHCYVPVTTSIALCSNDVNPAFGLCLPSSYQGNLWLLDDCQESYGKAPICESPTCELKICTTNCESANNCLSCDSPSPDKGRSACETTYIKSSPRGSSCPQTKGYVSNCYTPARYASKICQKLPNNYNCFRQLNYLCKSHRPINCCRLGSFGYRSFQNLGYVSSGFSPSCYITSSFQPQNYLTKNVQYLSTRPTSCRPLSYLHRTYRSLSCVPSTFPPLRYLCSSLLLEVKQNLYQELKLLIRGCLSGSGQGKLDDGIVVKLVSHGGSLPGVFVLPSESQHLRLLEVYKYFGDNCDKASNQIITSNT
ncbi:PREDICTED: keratin-associated protein 24-1-like [Elephantulus edwardii]|uniref:keratin-associated protein 24-1-like n=1 Tax=Elephantulus edwardii TaxID=28737 RepID=UPI0003F0B39D|nr:PREDICTED: keratin-associated protein 24-1-like [Elephantulus edwardii]